MGLVVLAIFQPELFATVVLKNVVRTAAIAARMTVRLAAMLVEQTVILAGKITGDCWKGTKRSVKRIRRYRQRKTKPKIV